MTSVARSRTVIDRSLTDDPGSLTNGISGSRDRSQPRMTRASQGYTNTGPPHPPRESESFRHRYWNDPKNAARHRDTRQPQQ